MSTLGTILTVGAAVATGGTGAGVIAGTALAGQAFSSGSAEDQHRLARVNWTLSEANAGSVLAAEIIMAAPRYVSGNEQQMWLDARARLNVAILQRAQDETGLKGWWPDGLPDFYTDANGTTHRTIVAQVAGASSPYTAAPAPGANGGYAPIGEGATYTASGGVQALPGMTTTAAAPSSSKTWLVVAALVVAVVAVVALRRR